MYNMSAHRLLWYYCPQWSFTMAWTVSDMIYTPQTSIYQNIAKLLTLPCLRLSHSLSLSLSSYSLCILEFSKLLVWYPGKLTDHNWVTQRLLFQSVSIATTLSCRGGCYSFHGIVPCTLDPYLIIPSSLFFFFFFFFCRTWPGVESWSSEPLVNTNHYTNGLVILYMLFLNGHSLKNYVLGTSLTTIVRL